MKKWMLGFVFLLALIISLFISYHIIGYTIYKHERDYYKDISKLYCEIGNKQKDLLGLSNVTLPSNLLEQDDCNHLGFERPLKRVFP